MLKESYIVEKSKALVWAQLKDYGAGQLKVLDTYLSRINARDPESSRVTFTRKEYAELMGLADDIRTHQLKAYTRGLLGNVVTMDLPGEGYVQYPLFSEAKCYYDEETNQTMVTIDCNPNLKQAFFDIAQDGYVRYQLKNVIAMKGQYSIRLYTMLKARPFGWTVAVDELKERLGATNATYDEFKHFNNLVLKKAIAEINEVTDIHVSVEGVRKGRYITAVKFTMENVCVLPEEPEPVPDAAGKQTEWEGEDPLALIIEDLPSEITREQAQVLKDAAGVHVPYEVASFAEKDLWISDYILSKVRLMNAQHPPVKSKFGWLRKAVAEDWQ